MRRGWRGCLSLRIRSFGPQPTFVNQDSEFLSHTDSRERVSPGCGRRLVRNRFLHKDSGPSGQCTGVSLLESGLCLFDEKLRKQHFANRAFVFPVGKTFHSRFAFSQAGRHRKLLQDDPFPSCGDCPLSLGVFYSLLVTEKCLSEADPSVV